MLPTEAVNTLEGSKFNLYYMNIHKRVSHV